MYLRTIAVERWPVVIMIERSLLPARAAAVAKPARREWPENDDSSSPTAATYLFTVSATTCGVSGVELTAPQRFTALKTGPDVIPAAANHRRRDRTGHDCGADPNGTPILRPAPSWSVF